MICVDTNVLIYAHRAETELHAQAVEALVELAEASAPWALPVFCVTEFLRVVTHPRVFNPPSSCADAVQFVEDLTASPSCRVLLPESGFLDALSRAVVDADAKGNLVFDAQIAGLCRQHGISTLLTNDRDFARFPNLEIRLLQ